MAEIRWSEDGTHFRNTSCDGHRFESTEESRFLRRGVGASLGRTHGQFDDPGTYHFYFAHAAETPCTILTSFPWPSAARGNIGSGRVTVTSFSAPKQRSSCLPDPDGFKLELVASVWNRESHAWGGAELRMDGPGDGIEVVFLSQ
jgi:catechol 2,3-dioxygenase-like lactoylglutathione lyase family enzyme